MTNEAPLIFSVSDFIAIFNQTVSAIYSNVTIVGEIANFRISKSRWVYFDLKDEYGSLKFFGAVTSLPGPLEDGMLVEVSGRPYLHPQFNFSVQFYSLIVMGKGDLDKAYRLLVKKLESEGLFDQSRKRNLPEFPNKIGLISSSESAGYGDFVKIAKNRWPRLDIKLFNVLVQGVDAPSQIVEAINLANQDDLDALVLVRGGGSRDDLVAFDDERVVRAVVASRVPTLVAVGHERDEVIAELVADQRASTPSNAAEVLLPDIKEETAKLKISKTQLAQSFNLYVGNIGSDINKSKSELGESINLKIMLADQWLAGAYNMLQAYDPYMPLKKGYVMAINQDGYLIRGARQAIEDKEFDLKFIDGKVKVKTKE